MEHIIASLENKSKEPNPFWRFPAENREVRLSELNELSVHYAAALHKLDVKPGDRVAVLLNTCIDYVGILLAIWRLNAIAVPLRAKGSLQTKYEQNIHYCDEVCDFKLMIYAEEGNTDFFTQWQMDKNKLAVPLSHLQNITANRFNDALYSYWHAEKDDIAILQFSSGSTGNPKGVIVTHGMMMAQLQNILYNHIGSRRGRPIDSLASWMPINHDMGLFIGILTPVYTGCVNLLVPPSFYMRNPSRWFQLLSDYHVDMTFSTNSVLASTLPILRRLRKRDGIDLSTLHLYIGAEKVNPVIVNRCYEVMGPLKLPKEHVHIGYGMAENALGAACTRTDLITQKRFEMVQQNELQEVDVTTANTIELVALGTPDRFHNITIRDEQDRILPDLMLGEINIQSACVSPGYYNNPAISEEKLANGRLRTGDLGFYYHGELYFYARKDDMIVTGGRNIIPDDIESLVEELDFVRPTASCLIGMENKRTGIAEINLLIEVKENSGAEELRDYRHKIQAHVYDNLDIMINRILFCVRGTVEKTSSGKKRRKVLQQRYAKGNIMTVGGLNG